MDKPHDESSRLIQQGIITPQALGFLKACVLARLNLAISGPSRSGKRMLLKELASLSSSTSEDEQILAIQNPDEPSLEGKEITTLRAALSPEQGKHIITRHYLLTLAPKMHPRGLLLDRVQGSEVLALLKLLFTMDGVIFSIEADSPGAALSNLERMLLLNEPGLDMNMVQRILASSLDLIIQLQRSQNGSIRVVNLTEVTETEGDVIVLRDIFVQEDVAENKDKFFGSLNPTGIKPQFIDRIQMLGISLPPETFTPPHKKKRAAS